MLKSICLFCGSSAGTNPEYLQVAKELGVFLAQQKIKLIYGGASIGIMDGVAAAHLSEGGHVVGIMPQSIIDLEVAQTNLSEFITTKDMHERKKLMHKMSDAFITLPGGMGTLDELCETITWAQLAFHKKTIIIFNYNGFYDYFIKHIKHMNKEGFFANDHLELFKVCNSTEELFTLLKTL